LLTSKTTSIVERTFGTRHSDICGNFMAYPKSISPVSGCQCEWSLNNPMPQTQYSQLKQWVKEIMD